MRQKKIKILFAGGGTGGHLMPIIAVAREIKRLHTENDLFLNYIGSIDEFSKILLRQEGIKVKMIISGKIRRYFSFENLIDIFFKIPVSFIESFFILLFFRPQLVFSKGGPGALPVTFSARILRIPVFIHESDIVPGLTNRITSKWAKRIFISFEKTEYFDLSKSILVGNPVRKEVLDGSRESAKEVLGITFEKPVILFLGGSQGSEAINDLLLLILNDVLKNYEVIHVCGKNNYKKVKGESDAILKKDLKKYYHLYEFLDEVGIRHSYKSADLIVSRSGAGSIFEIAATGKPSILIPLPSSASNHQSRNAYFYARTGAAMILEQENLIPNFFLGKINNLFSRPDLMEKMKMAALVFARPLAGKAIAREILEYLQ